MRRVIRDRIESRTVAIDYELSALGEDIVLIVSGGEAHIGSMALALPRPSRTGEGTSATSSVCNASSHQDEYVIRALAERLCAASGTAVAAIGGVHLDTFDQSVFQDVQAICDEALLRCDEWLKQLGDACGSED